MLSETLVKCSFCSDFCLGLKNIVSDSLIKRKHCLNECLRLRSKYSVVLLKIMYANFREFPTVAFWSRYREKLRQRSSENLKRRKCVEIATEGV